MRERRHNAGMLRGYRRRGSSFSRSGVVWADTPPDAPGLGIQVWRVVLVVPWERWASLDHLSH